MRRRLRRLVDRSTVGRRARALVHDRRVRRENAPVVGRLVDAGIVDQEWYEAQTREEFRDGKAVALHYLLRGRASGFSLHPLLEPSELDKGWRTADVDPVVAFLDAHGAVDTLHPMFDPVAYRREHPEAAGYPVGPLGHFLSGADDSSVLPVVEGLPTPARTYGPWRQRMLELARTQAARRAVRGATVESRWDSEAEAVAVARSLTVAGAAADGAGPRVTVVLLGADGSDVYRALSVLGSQSLREWELLVVADERGGGPPQEWDDPRVRTVVPVGSRSPVLDAALEFGTGRAVAFLDPRFGWRPRHLEVCVAALGHARARGVCAVTRIVTGGDPRYLTFPGSGADDPVGHLLPLPTLVVERALLESAQRRSHGAPGTVPDDLATLLSDSGEVVALRVVGADVAWADLAPGLPDVPAGARGATLVLRDQLVDWRAVGRALGARPAGRTSVLVAVRDDWSRAAASVCATLDACADDDVEVVVVDDGSSRARSLMIASVLAEVTDVSLHHLVRGRGQAGALDTAFAASTGDRVVLLGPHVVPGPGWLPPLLHELDDPEALGAQPLVTHPDGTIRSAGLVFPGGGGLPAPLLTDHPVSDAARHGTLAVRALTGIALVLRARDLHAVSGLDPVWETWDVVDLCLRLRRRTPEGSFRVVTSSRAEWVGSRTFARDRLRVGEADLLGLQWSDELEVGDDALWAGLGFDVVGLDASGDDASVGTPAELVPRPVLVVRPRQSDGSDPRLRWSLRVASRSGARGDLWGDTFFATDLAAALERLGQDVAVDRRDAYGRPTAHLDDVTVTLRGLVDVTPDPDQVNLLWLISHPDLVTVEELRRYDAAFAASISWSRRTTEETGIEVTPLLQATDPRRFHPTDVPVDGGSVVFVGNYREGRRMVTAALEAGIDLQLYGRQWGDEGYGDHVRAAFVPNDELGALYASAGAVLCDHWADMAREGFIANRVFDAVACGTRVVSDDVPGLGEVFGALVHVYREGDDLAEIVGVGRDAAFLPAEARHEEALRYGQLHSFDARARVLLDRALELRGQRGLA